MQEGNKAEVHILKNDQWHATEAILLTMQTHFSSDPQLWCGIIPPPCLAWSLQFSCSSAHSAPFSSPCFPIPPLASSPGTIPSPALSSPYPQNHVLLFSTSCSSQNVSVTPDPRKYQDTAPTDPHNPRHWHLSHSLVFTPCTRPWRELGTTKQLWCDWKPRFRSLATPNISFAPLLVAGKLGPKEADQNQANPVRILPAYGLGCPFISGTNIKKQQQQISLWIYLLFPAHLEYTWNILKKTRS